MSRRPVLCRAFFCCVRPRLPESARSAALAAFAVLALGALPASAQTIGAEQLAEMDSIAESPLVEGRIAGLAVGIMRGGDTLMWKAYGDADLEWDVPLTVDAVFEIGSVTKQFTSASILMLRDEGKIDLDADLTTYLPDYPTQGRSIPVRRLLDHTSGIKGYTEMQSFGEIATRNLPPDSLVARFAAEPFDFEPGEALIYNNSAYFLLGLIIEEVSGQTYAEYVEEHIFAPLGMERSSYCSNSAVVERRAHGYELTPGGLVRASYIDHVWPYAAGSLCSTVGDLMIWLRALHGGEVLPEASYQEMITPRPLNDGTAIRYAMGLARTPDSRGRPAIHHGGGIPGFLSDTRYYPDEDVMTVMLVNTAGNLSPTTLTTELVDVFLPRPTIDRPTFEGDAAPLAGTYSGAARGRALTVTVSVEDGTITVGPEGGQARPLQWVEGWTFMLGTQVVTFEQPGADGSAMVMRMDSGGGHYVLRRQPD